MNDATWPIAVLEIVSSGNLQRGCPIEVGFARWRALDAPLESWSALIRPHRDWILWSEEAEPMHGIARESLKASLFAEQVCRRLNAELFGYLLCCDGVACDRVWLSGLYEAGDTKPMFQLESIDKLHHWGDSRMARWLDVND